MADLSMWATPPESLPLPNDEVHVWRAALDQPASNVNALLQLLTRDEIDRAGKFHFQKHRDQFVVARGVLRTIIGRYLSLAPAQLRFSYNHYGKPALDEALASYQLCFNVSHSHELALFAFTRHRQIGLDIEYMREDFASEEIAERFFSRREVLTLLGLPAHLRTEGFFNCWTRKEAYIKADGKGLSIPLDQFDVSLAPGEQAALLSTAADAAEALRWSLKALTPGDGYAAAVAVEGHDWKLKCWQYS